MFVRENSQQFIVHSLSSTEKLNSPESTYKTGGIIPGKAAEWLIVACCTAMFIGFICSRALVSIGMIALLATAFLSSSPKQLFANYFRRPELWVLSIFLWIVVASGIYSDDKTDWLNWVRIKLPYLALPLAFAGIYKLSSRTFTLILYGFVLTFFASAVVILAQYAFNYEQVNQSFLSGSAIKVPYSHIRYSLMLSFSFFGALYMYREKLFLFTEKEKYLQLFLAGFAFAALHIISVRSGLLALYGGLLFLALHAIFTQRKWWLGLGVITCIVVLPVIAYKYVPSLHNKISYMRYDLQEYQRGNINDRSDAMRLLSMQIGLDIWQQHPIIGCGAGDLKTETFGIYERKYPQITPANYRLPHNQFIWVMATTGVVGLILFLAAFFYPFVATGLYRQWLAAVLFIALFSSFFTEHSLEEQMGTAFYLIFLLLLLNRFKHEE